MNHRPYIPGETIAAIATPPGEGGVAIIRISGNQALDAAAKIYSGPLLSYQTHTMHFGHLFIHLLEKSEQRLISIIPITKELMAETLF